LLAAGWTPGAAVAARLLIAALVLAVPAVRLIRSRPGQLRSGWPTVVLYGLVPVAGCQLCYFEAVQHLSVAVALLLEYSGALLVVGWMWLRHHQVPTGVTGAGAAVAVAGLAMVLDLFGHQHLSAVGVLWGLGAAVGLAVYFVVSARQREDSLPPLVVAWGGMATGAVAMGVFGLVGALPMRDPRHSVVLDHLHVSWLVPLLGIGVVAAAFAYVTGIAAARALGARLASFVGLAEVLFATLYAWLLLGQRLTYPQLVGAALVVAGIALVRLGEPAPAPAPAEAAIRTSAPVPAQAAI
jgi:drug/metabolite transporter (DMT)-like permease